MKIQLLELEHFQSYETAKIVFPDYKTIFITGINRDTGSSNGVGKSAIKEAIMYALWGRSKVRGSDIIQRGEKSASVSIKFEHNNHIVEITRIRKPQISTMSLIIDGQKQEGTQPELQQKVQNLLNVTQDSFITYSVIDKVRDTELSQLSSTDLRGVLQDLLGLTKIQQILELINKSKNELEGYLSRTKTRHYPSLKRLQVLTTQRGTLRKVLDTFNDTLVSEGEQLSAAQVRGVELTKDLQELQVKQQQALMTNKCSLCGHTPDPTTMVAILNKYGDEVAKISDLRAELEKEAQMLNTSIIATKNELQPVNNRLFKVLSHLTQLEESLKDQQDINKVVLEYNQHLEAIKTLQGYITTSLTGIASKVEDQMNSELGRFSDLFCKIRLEKTSSAGITLPTCSISVFRNQYEYTFDMLSSGEQALISLIFKLIISNLKGNISLLFVDEGLDALDAVNRERMLGVLETSNYQQIFIISHREDSAHLRAGQRILLRKEQGVSSILQV